MSSGRQRVAQTQAAVAFEIDIRQTTGHQLAEQRAPFALAHRLADTVHRQMLMAEAADFFVVLAQQHIHQMPDAITLAGAVDRRERLTGRLGGVPGLHAIDAVVAVAAGLGHVFVEVGQQGLTTAAGFFAEREHGVELVLLQTLVALVAFGVLQHLLEHHHVLQAVGHPGIRRQTVTAAATGFLVIGLKGFRQIEVRDKTHVGFVDAHAERHGGDHDQAFLVEEALLVMGARVVGQAGVVRQRREALLAEEHRHFVDFLARQAIDDAGIAAPLGEERQQLLARLLLGHDAVKNVRPVETRQEALGILQMQAIDDFFAGTLVGGGGQGDARNVGEQLRQLAQLQVFAAEVVAPLGHAVRFVDGEQGNFKALQEGQHARLHQTLGRQVEHLHFAALDPRRQVALLLGAQRGVQRSGGDAQLFEGGDLIVHQARSAATPPPPGLRATAPAPGSTGICRHR